MAAIAHDDSTPQNLYEAARSGNSNELLAILEIHPEFIDSKDSQGQTSLMLASKEGHHECVETLLKLGANPCIQDVIGWTCLHFAAYMGSIKVLEIILRCPDLPEFVNSLNNRSGTPLLLAVQRGHSHCVKEMLLHGASPWMIPEDLNGRTCLHYAAEKDFVNVVRELVVFCPIAKFLNFQGGDNPTAAILASKLGHVECLEVLLEHKADPFIVDEEGWSCLHYASNWGHLDMVEAIIAHTPDPAVQFIEMVTTGSDQSQYTAFRLAVEKQSTYCLRPLLEKGANPFAYAWDEWSCLHVAAKAGYSGAVDQILEFRPDQKDLRTKDGESTAFMLACGEGHWDVVETLLKYKVDILACNRGGFNCLHLAAEKGHIELIKSLLLEAGDEDYSEEFRYDRGRMVDKLQRVTDSSHGRTQTLLQLMEKRSSHEQLTPLHMAAIGPGGTAAVLLLERLYRTLALKVREFLVDPTSILFEYLSTADAVHMNFTLQASRKRFNNSIKKFMLRAHIAIGVETLSNSFDGRELGKSWRFRYQKIETQRIRTNQETETEEDWREKFQLWVCEGDRNVPRDRLCCFHRLADAYVAMIRYMNCKDCVGRTALHYLAGPYRKHPLIEDAKDIQEGLRTFDDVLQIPTLDFYALDNNQYSALHLAANSGNSIMIEAFTKLEYVSASVAFTNLEFTADSPLLSGVLLQQRRQLERKLRYSTRASSIKDPEGLLRGLVRNRGHGYEPQQGSCLAFLWLEERDGLIALHYAVDRCDKKSVKLLVEANRADLVVRTTDSSCASPFTIALSKGPQMYAVGGKWVSKHNLLCPSLDTLVFFGNFVISNQLLDTTLFEMLEQAALEYDPCDHRDFLRIWLELIWSMRELQQQQQIALVPSQKEKLVDQMDEEDHYEGLTILHYAAFRGRTKELKHLLGFDKLANMVNKPCVRTRQTFLHFAVIERKREVVDLFCKSDATSSALGESQSAPLKSISDIVRWNDEDRFGRTPYELVLDMISMTDALTRLDIRGDRETIKSLSALKQLEASLRRDKVVGDYIDKQFRDRQIHVDAGNTALVGAALIASVTFAGWLQPPLGYTAYEQLGSAVTGSSPPEYAAVRFEVVRVFWIFNSLSFFFAVATVVCGARAVLPAPSTVFIAKEVRSIRRWLVWTSLLLVISIICVLGAFGAAGFAVLPPEIKYRKGMAITISIGGATCVVGLIFYFLRLNTIGGLFRIPRKIRKWYMKRKQGSTMWKWSNEPMDDLKREQKLRLFGHQAPDSPWINIWNNISKKKQKNDTEEFLNILRELQERRSVHLTSGA